MSLVMRFLPGESVTIDGMTFAVDFDPPSLIREGHPPICIPPADELVLPGVMASPKLLSGSQRNAAETLGFSLIGGRLVGM